MRKRTEAVKQIHIALMMSENGVKVTKEAQAEELSLVIEFTKAAGGKLVSSRPEIGTAVLEVTEAQKQAIKAKFPKHGISEISTSTTFNLPRTF